MADVVLKIRDLGKKFGKYGVLEDISFNISSGEIFGIIGLTGSGKTTLLNLLIGFIKPTSGDVFFKQHHLLDESKDDNSLFRSVYKSGFEMKRVVGFATQEPSFYKKLSCEENIDYFGSLYGLKKKSRRINAEILLKLMGLYEFRKLDAGELSGGMQKRLDIACALIHDPHLLILDEPTADLDPISREKMWSLIKKINAKGTTIILTSHLLEELEQSCSRIGVLHDKKLVNIGTPEDMRRKYAKYYDLWLRTRSSDYEELKTQLEKLKDKYEIKNIESHGTRLVVKSANPNHLLYHVMDILAKSGETLLEVSLTKSMLKDVMESIIMKDKTAKK